MNSSKKKPTFLEENLSIYNTKQLRSVYTDFLKNYTAKDNGLKMLSETLHRKNIAKGFHQWMKINNKSFTN